MTATEHARCYRWDDLPQDHPMPAIARRRIVGEQAMIFELRLDAGCTVPTHAHDNEQFAYVVSGKMRFGIGAVDSPDHHEVTLTAGEVLHLPSNLPHSAFAVVDSLVLDVFSPTSEETGIDAS